MVLLAGILAVAGACAGERSGDSRLHVNDMQVIGTHNSYKQPLPPEELAAHRARDAAGADSIDYGFPPLDQQLERGVRQIELDVYDDPAGGRYLHPPDAAVMANPGFKVMHLADIDFRSSCVTWVECLRTVKIWSVAHPRHVPILILINAKDGPLGPGTAQPLPFDEAAFDRLDAETRSVFTDNELITPDQVQGTYPTLRSAVLAGRWPTLEQARGRMLFVLDEGPRKIAAYRGQRRSLQGRAMFVGAREDSPLASILVINDPVAEQARIAKAVAAGFLVRTRADADTREARNNDTRRREAAFASGAQFISTDYFDPDRRFSDYQVRFAGDEVARVNPLRGPVECRAVSLEPQPDLRLRGSLTGADNHTWRLVPFDVPEGVSRITVDFDYTTREARTTVDLGLLGPDGFRGQDGLRGWSGGNKRTFTVSATDATPSYLPGPIHAGRWNLLLGIPNIRPDTKAEFTADVHFERQGAGVGAGAGWIARAAPTGQTAPNGLTGPTGPTGATGPTGPFGPIVRAEPGWYRGDLHMHTAHSDGSCLSRLQQRVPCPLFLTARTASERGLDFIAITDHNTTSHAAAMRELQPFYDDLLLIPGREITTFQGHANLFGSVATVDFRVGSPEVPDWNALLANIEQTGGAISINHPIRPSGEQCMGCGWTPAVKVDYGRIQAVEVVNGPDADSAFSGIGFWEHLLDEGYRLTAIGGSDNHDALRTGGGGTIGVPTTVIYADTLSQAGIIAGIRRGRVFIDVAGTRDRALDLTASAGKRQANMGDVLIVPRGARVRFKGTVSGVSGGSAEVILDGRPVSLLKDSQLRGARVTFEFSWKADGRRHRLRIDVRDGESHLALIGNPIYLEN